MDAQELQSKLTERKEGLTQDLRDFLTWALANAPADFASGETTHEFATEFARRYEKLNSEEQACGDLLIDWSLQAA